MGGAAGILILFAVSAGAPAAWGQDDLFETRVRPLFAHKCYGCHTDSKLGGLRLDTREGFQKGGRSGPVAVAGDPEHSLIVKALRYTDARLKMPPTGRLTDEQIAAVETWIKLGAVWPETLAAPKQPPYRITAEQRRFWSFQPVLDVSPPAVRNTRWGRTGIDRFILAKLEANGLEPVSDADRRTLIRRATLDLTGLPPTSDEVIAFERDRSPGAFARVVDRLLASPRYGERVGRLWLDVARYSDDRLDSERDNFYENSFRYRDWVIQAIQDDMPYDLFVKAQIAGDLLPDHEKYEAGLGFYALSPEMQDDRVDATSRGFLGLTVACAQCHDHKYDPIPTRDFYSLLGIFRNTELTEIPLAPKDVVENYQAHKDLISKKEAEIKDFVEGQSAQLSEILAAQTSRYLLAADAKLDPETLARWEKYLNKPEKEHPFLRGWSAARDRNAAAAEFQDLVLSVLAEKKRVDDENHIRLGLHPSRDDLSKADLISLERNRFVLWEDLFGDSGVFHYGDGKIDRFLSGAWKEHLDLLHAQLTDLKKNLPSPYPFLHAVKELAKPTEQRVWIRGDQDNPGDPAPPHFLSILSAADPPAFQPGPARLQLAEAIASPANPLTARVIVNRVWRQHFGQGIVRTPSNFGTQGDPPSHPELLDYLAARFVREGWSLKNLHREILLSSVYALSAANSERNFARDPDNRLLWRFTRRRLDAESLRDSILSVSGKLDLKQGGRAIPLTSENSRRTVYAVVSRRRLDPMLALFDFPNPNNTSEQRLQTTVPLQKLFFMNSDFMMEQSRALAALLDAAPVDEARIRLAYRLVLQREPAADERRAAIEFLHSSRNAWPLYAQVLLSSNEFIYLQ
jgi:mono/diheme cytochrome c family protein